MAEKVFVESQPSLGTAGTLPANAGGLIRSNEWGIDNLLENAIVQSEDISCEDIYDDTQDQKGAVVSRLSYDRHYTLSLSFIGDSDKMPITGEGDVTCEVGQQDFTYADAKWHVVSVTYNGSYNGKKSYSLTAERYHNWPSQS